ncbi:MAG: LON peptidase substrate-binding domain-containing protein [Phycisphaerales bacterium]
MVPDETHVQVNFGKPFPLFPLDGVSLMPHALLRLFIFEPRYRQMIEDVLDSTGQIAMAVFRGKGWMNDYEGNPAIRPAVCIGQIARHECNPDGTYHIWLHGVCRARVVTEEGPDEARLYRQAILTPIDRNEHDESTLVEDRGRLLTLLKSRPLCELSRVKHVLGELETCELPTPALLDAVSLAVLSTLSDQAVQYKLLEEGDPRQRARIINRELKGLSTLLVRAERQFDPEAPRGVSWN